MHLKLIYSVDRKNSSAQSNQFQLKSYFYSLSSSLALIIINDKTMNYCVNIAIIYTLSEFVQNTKTNWLSKRDMNQLKIHYNSAGKNSCDSEISLDSVQILGEIF